MIGEGFATLSGTPTRPWPATTPSHPPRTLHAHPEWGWTIGGMLRGCRRLAGHRNRLGDCGDPLQDLLHLGIALFGCSPACHANSQSPATSQHQHVARTFSRNKPSKALSTTWKAGGVQKRSDCRGRWFSPDSCPSRLGGVHQKSASAVELRFAESPRDARTSKPRRGRRGSPGPRRQHRPSRASPLCTRLPSPVETELDRRWMWGKGEKRLSQSTPLDT